MFFQHAAVVCSLDDETDHASPGLG